MKNGSVQGNWLECKDRKARKDRKGSKEGLQTWFDFWTVLGDDGCVSSQKCFNSRGHVRCTARTLYIGEAMMRLRSILFLFSNMAKKLYVGGLPYSTTEESLRAAFSQAGNVSSANVITDRMSGRSKGFGFVEFENDADAEAAISMFHGKEFEGRTLTVNEARPLEERPPRRNNFGGGNGGGQRW